MPDLPSVTPSAPPQPHILGIRHHSPACAHLVAQRIRALRPAYVLIEGPADFNDRLDELALPHRLPIAIYSYLSSAAAHRGSWSPLTEHSPEWQALQTGFAIGAQVRFIDLPAWHDAFAHLENRYADVLDAEHERRAHAYEQALMQALAIQGRDALWDHLFEDGSSGDDLSQRLSTYFAHLRPADDPGSLGNQAREQMMARWIAWAVAQADGSAGRVLVVCGGYHAPALARLWSTLPGDLPIIPVPDAPPNDAPDTTPLRYGSYLVPYTFKRLDVLTGYASGMPSPAWYQWLWERGADGAAAQALEQIMRRLREKKRPVSTADLMAVHLRAQGLARLRGHARPLRSDWLDALVGALVKTALDVPLPWSDRGPIRPGTDPVLVEAMDVLAGDASGQLAPGTPQPPLVEAVRSELAALGISLPGTVSLDLLNPADRSKSRTLHRLRLLELPGITRRSGPKLALSGEASEVWHLASPMEQHAALIEAGAWGATLLDAARSKLEDTLRRAQGRITPLADGLNQAAWAGLASVSGHVLRELHAAIAAEPRFEALAPALGILHTLLRHGDLLGMAGAPVLQVVIEAGFDRALWLLEAPAAIPPAEIDDHLDGQIALCRIVADHLADAGDGSQHVTSALRIEPARALAVWQRKARDPAAAALSRGAALGATVHLAARSASSHADAANVADAMQLLHALPAPILGDALTGLLALARDTLTSEPAFAAGLDHRVQALDDADFVQALPGLRAAFAWLPPQERGALAEQIVALHGNTAGISRRTLTAAFSKDIPAEQWAATQASEAAVLGGLQVWGIGCEFMHKDIA